MSRLNLFPSHVAIGAFRGPDGRNVDVFSTPEFFRALKDLFVRVGGAEAPTLDEVQIINELNQVGDPVFVSQVVDNLEPNQSSEHGAQLYTLVRALEEAQLLAAAQGADKGEAIASVTRVYAELQMLAAAVTSTAAEVQSLRSTVNRLEVGDISPSTELQSLRSTIADIEMSIGYRDPYRVEWERPGQIGALTANSGAFTTVSASGQITSTVATGTAPLVIASTTQVSNLNVSQLVGATWVAPGTIGSSTRNTGAFTTLFVNTGAVIEPGSQCVLMNANSTEYSLPSLWAGHSTQKDIVVYNGTSTGASGSAAVLFVSTKNSSTSRSINAAGTINASGADYAEYMTKADDCGEIAKGQIVGITVDGKVTDKWVDAIAFAIKSTDPSYVGGDTWGTQEVLGERPVLSPQGEGETDAEYLAREDAFYIDLVSYESDLESARRMVDRVAFSGRVPCNVLGTTPGHYIVPVQDSSGIKGVSIAEPTLQEYMRAVGRVIAIEKDGRAQVVVKIG